MEINKKLVGQRLKQLLKQKFGTINKAAEELGTTATSLSSGYLNGRSLPGPELIAKLILLNFDVYWLLTGEERFDDIFNFDHNSIMEDNFKKSFGRNLSIGFRLKKLREKRRLNKTQFANLLELEFYELDQLENSGILPSLEKIIKLCRILEIDLEWLLTGEEELPVKINNDDLTFSEKQLLKKLRIVPDMQKLLTKILDGEIAKRDAEKKI